jgi:hypothetical protein
MWGIELKDVIIFFVGLPVAFLISWYFYRRSISRKQLVYSIKLEDVLVKGKQYPTGLKISYNEQPIDVLAKGEIYFWNGGNQPITKADLDTADRLRIEWPDEFKVLDYAVRYESRAANGFALVDQLLTFAFLNVNDGVIIDVVGTRDSSQRKLYPRMYGKIRGEVIGAEHQPRSEDFIFSVKRNYVPLILIGLLVPPFLAYGIYNDRQQLYEDFGWLYWPAAVGLGFVALLAFLIGLVGVYGWLRGNRVPINLIAGGLDRRLTWGEWLKLYF